MKNKFIDPHCGLTDRNNKVVPVTQQGPTASHIVQATSPPKINLTANISCITNQWKQLHHARHTLLRHWHLPD
jgi:hypothetical protein